MAMAGRQNRAGEDGEIAQVGHATVDLGPWNGLWSCVEKSRRARAPARTTTKMVDVRDELNFCRFKLGQTDAL